jgi:MFS family permease
LTFPTFVLLVLGLTVGYSQIAATKAVLDWFPFAGRATAMGIRQTGINIGGIVGSLVLPILLSLYGWHLLFKWMGGLRSYRFYSIPYNISISTLYRIQ